MLQQDGNFDPRDSVIHGVDNRPASARARSLRDDRSIQARLASRCKQDDGTAVRRARIDDAVRFDIGLCLDPLHAVIGVRRAVLKIILGIDMAPVAIDHDTAAIRSAISTPLGMEITILRRFTKGPHGASGLKDGLLTVFASFDP